MARVGLDWRPFAHATDPAERLLELAVAIQAAEWIERDHDVDQHNLGVAVSNAIAKAFS